MPEKLSLLFDFDGTIADTLHTLIKIYNNRLSKPFFCKPVLPEEIDFLKNQSYQYLAKKYGITFWKLPLLAARVRQLLKNEMRNIPPIENIASQLQELKNQKFQISILSSNSQKNINRFLQNNQMEGLFDKIHTERNLFGKDKPLKHFLNKNSLSKDQLIYIGDEVRDIHAAKKVGIRVAAVTWGFHGKEVLEKEQPDFLMEEVSELLKLTGFRSRI